MSFAIESGREGARLDPARPARLRDIPISRSDALRRFAAEVSGKTDLDDLFRDVIDESFALFAVDEAGLWLYDGTETPLSLAAQRGLSIEVLTSVARLRRDAPTTGMDAIRERRVRVLGGDLLGTAPELRRTYLRNGIRTICFVPVVYGDEALGLLVLYHHERYPWTDDETELARAFADHLATAIANARLIAASSRLAERLRVIADLAADLDSATDIDAIAQVIVREARRLIDHDSIRVYRVDHDAGVCEPLAFQGHFMGTEEPPADALRVPIGTGLTGWVAAHNEPLRIGDAERDPRSVIVGPTAGPESMLIVPMTYDGVVSGLIVASRAGIDRFDADDERTLSIFAGYAAHAFVNVTHVERLRLQEAELEHRLATQQRLLDVNERLLSTLEPTSVLDLIADSLKAIVPYDSLTIYRVDRPSGTRRAVVARDRYAEEILADIGPIGGGITGWVIEQGEPYLSNEAHLDPRSVQVPGTPYEPEALIVVPLVAAGEVLGTLNIGRLGGPEMGFTSNEFELTKLFAGQASIALRNAEEHGEVRVRAERDALTGLRNHGAFQRELGELVADPEVRPFAVLMLDLDGFKGFNDTCGHPAGDALLAAVAGALTGSTREGDRLYRYGGDELAVILSGAQRVAAHEVAERIRHAVASLPLPDGAPRVTISTGVACYPDDGTTKDALVAVADQALYLAKPTRGSRIDPTDDPYLRALDETAMALRDRTDPRNLLETIMTRATGLLGSPHGYIYLFDADTDELVLRHGKGLFTGYVGVRLPIDQGVGGQVFRTGLPLTVPDYDSFEGRAQSLPSSQFGAVVGVPLTSGSTTVGVLGLASGSLDRTFGPREIDALSRFAQLASIALDNARLFESAQHHALYDQTTGLPNRGLLVDRIAHALTYTRPDLMDPIAVLLLDLDRFKVINESVGHGVGDRLLAAVAHRLEESVRPGDTVARFGGDEFGIILDSVADFEEAERVADSILAELRAPFVLGEREWYLSASMGISLAAPGSATPDELLRQAEIALVRAKLEAVGRHSRFEPSMSTQTIERFDLESDLRRAIERDELRLEYQPIIDLATDHIVGFEALVRWQHPTRGLIPPLSFIPVAEESGLIVPIGRWVLETACRQAAAWRRERPDGPRPTISVNLSAAEFSQPDLPEVIARLLLETGLDPEALSLEITETVLMDQTERGTRILASLRETGVRLVLDDFGTGYSSLSYLRLLPIDTLKIDRSFVDGMETPADRSIVTAVIALGHGLGLRVVAEGIETEGQRLALRELACDLGQGYLFSPPTTAADAGRLLDARGAR
jgi:diguanylate cyclase (GGDEF)-like protein